MNKLAQPPYFYSSDGQKKISIPMILATSSGPKFSELPLNLDIDDEAPLNVPKHASWL